MFARAGNEHHTLAVLDWTVFARLEIDSPSVRVNPDRDEGSLYLESAAFAPEPGVGPSLARGCLVTQQRRQSTQERVGTCFRGMNARLSVLGGQEWRCNHETSTAQSANLKL